MEKKKRKVNLCCQLLEKHQGLFCLCKEKERKEGRGVEEEIVVWWLGSVLAGGLQRVRARRGRSWPAGGDYRWRDVFVWLLRLVFFFVGVFFYFSCMPFFFKSLPLSLSLSDSLSSSCCCHPYLCLSFRYLRVLLNQFTRTNKGHVFVSVCVCLSLSLSICQSASFSPQSWTLTAQTSIHSHAVCTHAFSVSP